MSEGKWRPEKRRVIRSLKLENLSDHNVSVEVCDRTLNSGSETPLYQVSDIFKLGKATLVYGVYTTCDGNK